MGDGAPWIWNLAQTHCPQAVQIVDWFHAKDRLWTVANSLFGERTSRVQSWIEAKTKQLHDGNIKGITYALQGYSDLDPEQQEEVRQAINYFGNNYKRMQYQDFRAKGYHIGSGVVESACKHLIAAREKQAGMRWSLEGAENIAQLRTCIRNKRYDAFWPSVHLQNDVIGELHLLTNTFYLQILDRPRLPLLFHRNAHPSKEEVCGTSPSTAL